MVHLVPTPQGSMEIEEGDGQKDKEVMEEEDNKKVVQETTLPFYKLLSYADWLDWIMMGLGTFGSVIHGMAQPVGYYLLGRALNGYGSNIGNNQAIVHALKQVSSSNGSFYVD